MIGGLVCISVSSVCGCAHVCVNKCECVCMCVCVCRCVCVCVCLGVRETDFMVLLKLYYNCTFLQYLYLK